MAAKLTRLTHKTAIQLHLVAESCTICSSRSRRPVRKLLGTPLCFLVFQNFNRIIKLPVDLWSSESSFCYSDVHAKYTQDISSEDEISSLTKALSLSHTEQLLLPTCVICVRVLTRLCFVLCCLQRWRETLLRRPHNEKLHNLYDSPNIARVTKSRRMGRVEHVARMGEMRNVNKILVEGKI
jgi:hypothetical protein